MVDADTALRFGNSVTGARCGPADLRARETVLIFIAVGLMIIGRIPGHALGPAYDYYSYGCARGCRQSPTGPSTKQIGRRSNGSVDRRDERSFVVDTVSNRPDSPRSFVPGVDGTQRHDTRTRNNENCVAYYGQ